MGEGKEIGRDGESERQGQRKGETGRRRDEEIIRKNRKKNMLFMFNYNHKRVVAEMSVYLVYFHQHLNINFHCLTRVE